MLYLFRAVTISKSLMLREIVFFMHYAASVIFLSQYLIPLRRKI